MSGPEDDDFLDGMCDLDFDNGPPTSHVTGATFQANPPLAIATWQGQDDAGGSGVGSYDIYVSEDGAAYQAWKVNKASPRRNTSPGPKRISATRWPPTQVPFWLPKSLTMKPPFRYSMLA